MTDITGVREAALHDQKEGHRAGFRAGSASWWLDELGDLPLLLQVNLLRFLQEKTFERAGRQCADRQTVLIGKRPV